MRVFTILQEQVDENGLSRYAADICPLGFIDESEANDHISKMRQEDAMRGWLYRYFVFAVNVNAEEK